MDPRDYQMELDNRDAEIDRLNARITELEAELADMAKWAGVELGEAK